MAIGEDIRGLLQHAEDAAGADLSPVERLLLSTDGTVTHMLEALIRGPVSVDILNRDVQGSTLHRDVVLRRESDGSRLVWATSDVNLYPMEMEMEEALVDGSIGIGELLRKEYTETRRQIIAMNAIWAEDDEFPQFISGASVLYLSRTYRVYSDDDRLMEITEYFPKGFY